MRVNLLTDAPKHNLALMKLASYHRGRGDVITLNAPQTPCDISYGSWLYNQDYPTTFAGGPAVDPAIHLNGAADCFPDYTLYDLDYSLGYTWRSCLRRCKFCVVPKQHNAREHRSIWDFHDPQFTTICLLNNNTFSDPRWLDTFAEIWDAALTVKDENGYDLRLLGHEHAKALKRTRWAGYLHFAWDRMRDSEAIIRGLDMARRHHLRKVVVYVMVGFDTTTEQDLARCEVIDWFGFDPYIMPYRQPGRRASQPARIFKRFIDSRMYRKYPTMTDAFEAYRE